MDSAPPSTPFKKKRAFPHREKIAKVCEVCLAPFYCVHSQQSLRRTCSRACSHTLATRRITKNCPICECQFETTHWKNKTTCSKRCANYFRREDGKAHWSRDFQKTCPNCGKLYNADKDWRQSKMFCGRPCLQEHYRKNGGPTSKPVGSRYKDDQGYWIIKIGIKNWRSEHVVIAEKMIGRRLLRNEIVHHRNGDKADNREDNLQVVTKSIHARMHNKAEWLGLSMLAQKTALPMLAGEWVHPLEGCEV